MRVYKVFKQITAAHNLWKSGDIGNSQKLLACHSRVDYKSPTQLRGHGGTGRRKGLKIPRGQPRAGSTPAARTIIQLFNHHDIKSSALGGIGQKSKGRCAFGRIDFISGRSVIDGLAGVQAGAFGAHCSVAGGNDLNGFGLDC